MNLNWYGKSLMLAALAATIGGGDLWAQESDGDAKVVEAKPVDVQPADAVKPAAEAAERHFWIGAKLAAEMPPLLKRHLPQLADKGVFVEGVFAESPAGQAGLEAEDVVLELNGQPLVDARKLVEAVRGGEGAALKLKVLHNGQESAIEVTPRPITPEDVAAIRKAEMLLGRGDDQVEDPQRMRFFGPGQMMPQAGVMPALPQAGQNLTIQIEDQGDKPAKLHIVKDGKSYDITADQLDTLPEDIRPFIQQFMGADSDLKFGELNLDLMDPPGMPDGMMRQQLQQIHQMLEELKAQMGGRMPNQPQQPAAEDDHAI